MESDVTDVREKLAQTLFDHIPVGVGSQGIIPTTAPDLEAALEMGMDWSLREVRLVISGFPYLANACLPASVPTQETLLTKNARDDRSGLCGNYRAKAVKPSPLSPLSLWNFSTLVPTLSLVYRSSSGSYRNISCFRRYALLLLLAWQLSRV